MNSLIRTFVVFIILAFTSAAYAKDTLVIGITQFPGTLNAHFDSMLAKYYVLNMTLRPFTVYDKDWKLICMLCTEVPTLQNGKAVLEIYEGDKQGIAVTYNINPDAKWGDGTPVTTKDVVFTIEAGQHVDSGMIGGDLYRRIRQVDVVDDKTFTLHVDRVTYDYNALSLYLLPEHIERANFANPLEFKNKTAYDTDTYNPALYFGPYRITKVEQGAFIELEPNETWYGPIPQFKKIIVQIIENTAALQANLLSGSIDLIDGSLGMTLDQGLAFQKRNPNAFDYIFKLGLIYEHIDLNLDNPILNDLRVRKALLHGVDREAISQKLFKGKQPVAHVFVNPLDSVYYKQVKKYEFNPQLAAELLDQAGWSFIKEGTRHNESGEPLILEFGTTAGSRVRESVQQVLQSQWRAIGVDVRIRNEPARVFFGETVLKRKFSGLVMYAWIQNPESSPRDILRSDRIPTAQNNYAGSNYTGYENPKLDELIDAMEIELDFEKRKAIWAEIQTIYVEDLPILPLYYRANPYIIPKWLKGIEPTGNSATISLWVENWRYEP